MEPVSAAIIAALVAGATAGLKGVASDAVKTAYNALKSLLVGKVSNLSNIEEDPDDKDYQKAAGKELQKKKISDDPIVLEKARQLTDALTREPSEQLKKAGIDIAQVHAAGDVVVKTLKARGDVIVKDIEAKTGKIQIEDITAGSESEKK
jgi:hypothetical protein